MTASPTSTPTVDTVPRRSFTRRLVAPLLLLLCLCGGVAAGIVGSKYAKPAQPEEPAEQTTEKVEAHEPVVELTHTSDIAQIDTLIRAGSFNEALAACQTGSRTGEMDERALAYREAVCLEAIGRLKEATEAYKHAANESDLAAWARAMLGQARCAVASSDLSEAQALLDRVVPRSGHPDCVGTHVYEECLFLRACIDALRLEPVRALNPFDPDAIAWPSLSGALDKYHVWLAPVADSTSSGDPVAPAAVNSTAITASTDRASVAESFRRVLAAAPTHPSAYAMRIWLGNFHFVEGKMREAAAEYVKLLDESPEAETPQAFYNLGLTESRMGNLSSSRSRFVNLIDHGTRTKWADYAWWWVGRSHFDTGDRSAAKKAFNSALLGRTREITSAAALAICACELLDGNDEAAWNVLSETRIDSRDEHTAIANCFEKLSHYRTAPTENRRELLLSAMRDASDCRQLGPSGAFLAGRIYRDLGLAERMAAVYDSATESIRGPLATRMMFDAAAWYELVDQLELARARYLAVAATDPKGLGPQAELRLAEIACRKRDTKDCIRRCRALLEQKNVDKLEVLAVMGRAYELQRKYGLAADCFAGRIPVE